MYSTPFIASTTVLAILGTVSAERVSIEAYTATALSTLNIILSIINKNLQQHLETKRDINNIYIERSWRTRSLKISLKKRRKL